MTKPGVPVDLILSKLAQDTGGIQSRLQKASDVLLSPLETKIASTPYEVVYQEDRVKLKYYKAKKDTKKNTKKNKKPAMKTPLLVIYALINRETMLDLQPKKSVTESFLN